MAETTTAPAAPAAPATPAAPAKSANPPIPAAQAASVTAPPAKAAPEVPSAPGFQKSESIEALMKKTAREAFAPENLPPGKELILTPKEPVKAETPPEPKKDKKTVFDAVETTKPAEKPAAAPTETKDRFSDIAPPDGATEVTQKGWKALKDKANAEIAAAEKRVSDAQAQLETFRKASPADLADVAKLKADHQAALDRLAVLDLSAHPDFQKQYTEPKKRALATAETLVKDYAKDGAAVDVGELMGLSRPEFAKRVSDLAKDMPVFDQADFTTNMREAYRLQGEERGALSKAGELRAQLQAKNAQQEKTAFEETWKPFDEMLKPREVPDNASDEEKSDVENYNNARAALRQEAERYAFGAQSPKDIAAIATKAAATDLFTKTVIPEMARKHAALQQDYAKVVAELKAIHDKKNPGTFSAAADSSPRDISKGTFRDAMDEAKRMSGKS